jgi:hypothetical protein
MEEENNPLWPWLLGLLVLKVYRNKKNTAHQDLSYFNNDKFEDFDIYWEEE